MTFFRFPFVTLCVAGTLIGCASEAPVTTAKGRRRPQPHHTDASVPREAVSRGGRILLEQLDSSFGRHRRSVANWNC